MATTTPREFEGEPRLTPDIVATITEAYRSNLGDSDKAAAGGDVEWYSGAAEAYEHVLALIHGVPVDEPARHMPDLHKHVPNGLYAEAHAFMTRTDRPGRGYKVMPESGWWVYEGPRLVTVTQWDEHGSLVKEEKVEHAQILRVLQDHLDDLAILTGSDDPYYELAENAFSLVLSDVQTGTSLHSWHIARRLVDRSLTAATLHLDHPGHRITTAWEEF